MNEKLNNFIKIYENNRVDFDGSFGYQCNDLTRMRLKFLGLPQYKALGNNGCKMIALNPQAYLLAPLSWTKNNIKDKDQIPNPGDIVIFSKPEETGHIAIVVEALKGMPTFLVFEQNAGNGNGNGLGENACKIRRKKYNDVYGWINVKF